MFHKMCTPNPKIANEKKICISRCVDQSHSMPARTQNSYQLVMTKSIPCQQGHIIYLKLRWPSPSHASEDIKWFSTSVGQFPHASKDTKCISTCNDKIYAMPARAQNVSQLALTKSLTCLRGHKMIFNMCWSIPTCQRRHKIHLNKSWPNPSHARNDTKSISTRFEWAPHMPARNKMYLNMCWPFPSHANEDRKCISTCVDQNPPKSARTQNIS